jgi:organizing structure protein 2
MPYFLPKTSANLREYLSEVEDKQFPEFAQKHDTFNARLSMHWEMLKDKVGSAEQAAGGWGEKAVKGIESTTGLRVGDVIRQGQEKVQQQKEKLQGTVKIGQEPVKVQTVGYVVETRPVAEIVAPVTPESPANAANALAEVERPIVVPVAAVPQATEVPKVKEEKSEKRLV